MKQSSPDERDKERTKAVQQESAVTKIMKEDERERPCWFGDGENFNITWI